IASDVQPFYDEDEITIELQFQSLHDVHFTRGLLFDTPKSNKSYLYLFSLVGLLMLCMAAINYINLTLADGALRSKEVAVRKVAGADRASILLQIFGENVLITSLAFVMSLVLCIIVFPYFLQLTESKLSLSDFISFKPLFILFLVFVGINLLCSTYPALFFSSFSPAKVLKGKFIGGDKLQVQKVMLTTQFVISAGMIICTLVILKQMDFIRNRDSGLALDQVVKVPLPLNENAQKRAVQFRNALLQQSGIADASIAGFNAIPGGETDLDVFTVEGATETIKRVVSYIDVDDHYFDILDLDVIAGRRFIRDSEADKVGSYIVNEAYVSLMGWDSYEEDVLDRGVIVPDFYEQGVEGSIIGIVKDFNFRSVHHKIEPLIIVYSDEYPGFVLAKSATNNMTDVIGQIRDTWFNFYPEYVFDYAFLDEHYGKQYDKENTMYKLFSLFTALSIFITVLGLFSLSLITIRQKIKAIGIRRVLGASMVNLLGEFNKEFMVIIGIALLITMPLSWWIMNEWLDSFAYKAPLTMEVFIIAGLFSAFMTLITTSYHIIKAGNLNPVETLKHE
ncbi:MAG: FtsX-like permease family protein, partial [Bacteroidota bacterium]